jgi:hypothetical protein
MRTKINLEKIINQYEKSSFFIWTDTVQEILSILDHDENEFDSDMIKSLSNYVVIRLVSAIESFFRNRARELIDEENANVLGIYPNNEMKISINELDKIKNDKISKGRIIVSGINFQNLKEVYNVFNHLLEIKNFEKEIKKKKGNTVKVYGDFYNFEVGRIEELLDIRHKIIHEMTDTEFNFKKLREYLANCVILFAISDSILDERESKKTKSKSKTITKKKGEKSKKSTF